MIGYLLAQVRTTDRPYLPRATQNQIADLFRAGLLNPCRRAVRQHPRSTQRNGLITATTTS